MKWKTSRIFCCYPSFHHNKWENTRIDPYSFEKQHSFHSTKKGQCKHMLHGPFNRKSLMTTNHTSTANLIKHPIFGLPCKATSTVSSRLSASVAKKVARNREIAKCIVEALQACDKQYVDIRRARKSRK